MNILLQFLLIGHIIFGLLGIILFYILLMALLKPLNSNKIKSLKKYSFFGFLSFVLSWLFGGHYYVIYYGAFVKPIIKKGAYPWAHSIFMETKEHIFLFLPFAALITVFIFYFLGEELEKKPAIKKAVLLLSSVIVIIGTIVALMGITVSGAVR